MQPPDELMVGVFLPSMRQLVARALRSQGLSQNRISGLLGITQASVSLYLSSGTQKAYSSLATLSLGREDADRYAALLAEDVKRSAVYGVETLGSVWRNMLGSGMVCEAHRKLYPSLAQCDVCVKEYGSKRAGRSDAISQVREAVKILEGSRALVSVMPEVSVNLALAEDDSSSPADVVAVPGRIVRVKGAAKAMLPPEYGASRHMARVLLLVRRRRGEVRAAVNLRYDKRMNAVLRKLRLTRLEIGGYVPSGLEDPTVEALAAKLAGTKAEFDVVVDHGGEGVEPNLYLFGKSAIEVARLAVKVAGLYSAD
ncbi:MAG: hypothetical protein LYZ66_02555 [Nitrososphaerales archaeon]|nr:hypothetical protein [Nitrososphaerales archaeon]